MARSFVTKSLDTSRLVRPKGSRKKLAGTDRSSQQPREGAVLVAVLACMVITMVLVGGAIKSTLTARKLCKSELRMQQAELLLQAGIDRVGQLEIASQASTTIPTWDVRSAFPSYSQAQVAYLLVDSDQADRLSVKCTVQLALTDRPQDTIQYSRVVTIPNPSKKL